MLNNISDGSTLMLRYSLESLPEGSPINHDTYQFEFRIMKCYIQRINGPEGMRDTHYSDVHLHNIIPFSITQAVALSPDLFRVTGLLVGEYHLAMIREFMVLFTTRLRPGAHFIGVIEFMWADIRTSWYDGGTCINEVNKLELVKYKEGGVIGDELGRTTICCCCVCLEEFEEDMLVVRTRCSHYFHDKCVSTWMNTNTTCPLCRSKVV